MAHPAAPPPTPSGLDAATPWRVDALIRDALARAAGCRAEDLPAADVRRAAGPAAPGDQAGPDPADPAGPAAASGRGGPSAEPGGRAGREAPFAAAGRCTSALPLRVAARARRPARGLAEAAAAHLRRHPLVADAAAEGPGFVAVTPAAPAWSALVARVAADPGTYLGGYLARPFASVPSADSGHLDDLDGLVGPDHPPDPEHPGPAGPPDAGAPGTWAPLADAPTVAEARLRARAAARRRIAAADRLLPALAEGRGRMPGGGPGGAEVSWRDPCLDRGPDGFTTAAGRLLGVIGEASARVAFCRSAGERPRPGELTGPDLPALPTAERPGAWARSTFDNPAFAVRYARAHALSTLRWAGAAHPPAPGDTPSPAPGGAGPAPGAADGGAAAAPPARPGRPPSGTAPPAPRAALIGALFDGPVVVRAAERRSEPHMLVRYLEGLAIAYHDWWESSGVLRGETARGSGGDDALALCAAVAGVLGSGLSLLGVSAPTRL